MKLFYTISIFFQHVRYVNTRELIVNCLHNHIKSRSFSRGKASVVATRGRSEPAPKRGGASKGMYQWDSGARENNTWYVYCVYKTLDNILVSCRRLAG